MDALLDDGDYMVAWHCSNNLEKSPLFLSNRRYILNKINAILDDIGFVMAQLDSNALEKNAVVLLKGIGFPAWLSQVKAAYPMTKYYVPRTHWTRSLNDPADVRASPGQRKSTWNVKVVQDVVPELE